MTQCPDSTLLHAKEEGKGGRKEFHLQDKESSGRISKCSSSSFIDSVGSDEGRIGAVWPDMQGAFRRLSGAVPKSGHTEDRARQSLATHSKYVEDCFLDSISRDYTEPLVDPVNA